MNQKNGRPPKSNQKEIKDTICRLVSTTSYGLRKIVELVVKELGGTLNLSTVVLWLRQDEEFSTQYAIAKEAQCDLLAEELIDIADDSSMDIVVTEEGRSSVDREHINRSRLRVDTRKWILSKLKAKKYGDKIEISGNADAPLVVISDARAKG